MRLVVPVLAVLLLFAPAARAQKLSFTETDYPAGQPGRGQSVAVGDFDGDGIPDLAVLDQAGATVSVLLGGKPDGTFLAPQSVSIPYAPCMSSLQVYCMINPSMAIAVGDFNGDGLTDLAVGMQLNVPCDHPFCYQATVAVLLGNGDGTFRQPPLISIEDPNGDLGGALAHPPTFLAVGDFNGDSILDVVVASSSGIGQAVMLGNGDGTFRLASILFVGTSGALNSLSVALGDFDEDGTLDIVIGSDSPDCGAPCYGGNLFLGTGDGTFRRSNSCVLCGLASLVAGDFNGDGNLDVAATGGGVLAVALGNGDGSFQQLATYTLTVGLGVLAVGNFDRGATLDLAAVRGTGVAILLGNGDGTFQAPQTFDVGGGSPVWIVAADLTNRSRRSPDDVAVTIPSGVAVLINKH